MPEFHSLCAYLDQDYCAPSGGNYVQMGPGFLGGVGQIEKRRPQGLKPNRFERFEARRHEPFYIKRHAASDASMSLLDH
jgi:hypothetical protein